MTRRTIAWILMLLLIGIVAFVAANVIDYRRFHRAIHRLENLSEEQFRALGDVAAQVKQLNRQAGPDGFEALRPIGVSLYPGSSDLLLYELKPWRPRFEEDLIYLYARISTSPNNQEILWFTNSEGKQRTKVVWNRNPEFVRKHSPENRILTISQWGRRSRSWIILNDRLLVIDEDGRSGGEPSITGSVVLRDADVARIKEEIAKVSPSAWGKDYRADGVSDGISLVIRRSPNGEAGQEDVMISNTWVEDFRALLAAVSELAPEGRSITFIENMTTPERLRDYPTTVRTLAEREKLDWPEPNTPWWCVWRSWLK